MSECHQVTDKAEKKESFWKGPDLSHWSLGWDAHGDVET